MSDSEKPAVRPLLDYVVLKTDADETVSRGGILLPPAGERHMFARVLSLPPHPAVRGVSVGDRVVFKSGACATYSKRPDGSAVVLVPWYDVLAVVEDG